MQKVFAYPPGPLDPAAAAAIVRGLPMAIPAPPLAAAAGEPDPVRCAAALLEQEAWLDRLEVPARRPARRRRFS